MPKEYWYDYDEAKKEWVLYTNRGEVWRGSSWLRIEHLILVLKRYGFKQA